MFIPCPLKQRRMYFKVNFVTDLSRQPSRCHPRPISTNQGAATRFHPRQPSCFISFTIFLPQNDEVVKENNEIILYSNLIN
jgi:hypothetical protein